MGGAPERIWLDWPDANRGDVVYAEPPERDTQPGQTGYVRADLHDATRARVRELEAGNRGLLRLNEETESRAEKAETRNKELVMQSLADLGQAQEAYEAQKTAEAEIERLRAALELRLDGSRPLPFDRDTVGRMVREAWVRWAETQPTPKPSWLVPYDDLNEPDKEADRQIGEAVARWTLAFDASRAALEQNATETATSEHLSEQAGERGKEFPLND